MQREKWSIWAALVSLGFFTSGSYQCTPNNKKTWGIPRAFFVMHNYVYARLILYQERYSKTKEKARGNDSKHPIERNGLT